MAIARREQSPIARFTGRELDPYRTLRSLLNWDPFQEMAPRMLLGDEGRLAFAPAFDVKETKDAYEFKADLPGFREQDVDINVSGNRLTISGKREAEQVDESETYFCSEREYGAFTRSFTLPEGVNAEQVEADMRNGVLEVHVPKAAEAQAKRIPVKAGASEQKAQRRPEMKSESKSEAESKTKPESKAG